MSLFSVSRPRVPSAAGSLVGDVAKYLITRSVLKRVTRVGGVQGVLLGVAATYALNHLLRPRR